MPYGDHTNDARTILQGGVERPNDVPDQGARRTRRGPPTLHAQFFGDLPVSGTKVLSASGSTTPVGALVKMVQKVPAGVVTPTGVLAKSIIKAFAGTITPAGALLKTVGKALGGTITPSIATTIAHDAATKVVNLSSANPRTFTHTPVGTPRGILVCINHAAPGNPGVDAITGVTYGGVAMTRVGETWDTAGEPGGVYMYFLGEIRGLSPSPGIPTGAQTVSISHDGTTMNADSSATCISLTGSHDLITFSGAESRQDDQANPRSSGSGSAPTAGQVGLRYGVIYSGLPAPTDLTMLAGMTAVTSDTYSASSARVDRQTSPSAGNTFILGWGAASDDVAALFLPIWVGTGGLLKRVTKVISGSTTPAGGLTKTVFKAFGGATTPVGALVNNKLKVLAVSGVIAPVGALVKRVGKIVAGSTSPSGATTKRVAKTVAGTTTPVGVTTKRPSKTFGGTTTPVGALVAAKFKVIVVGGVIAPVGALVKRVSKVLGGTVAPVGTTTKRVSKTQGGAVLPAGALSKTVAKAIGGTVAPSGALTLVEVVGFVQKGVVFVWSRAIHLVRAVVGLTTRGDVDVSSKVLDAVEITERLTGDRARSVDRAVHTVRATDARRTV